MTIGIDMDLRDARLLLIQEAIDFEADEYNTGKLRIYSGERPDTGAEPDEYDNVLLAEFNLPYPCGSITEGILTFNEIISVYGLVNGVASWGRIVDADDAFIMDLSVTSILGNGDIKIDDVNIVINVLIICSLASLIEGNS